MIGSHPQTIAELRDQVAVALSTQLGTYTYKTPTSTHTTPALLVAGASAVLIGGRLWDKKPDSVTGLEVIIQPAIASDYQPMLNNEFLFRDRGQLILRQWDATRTLIEARGKLLIHFGNFFDEVGDRLPRNTVLDSIEQIIFTFSLNLQQED